jgi:ABC-2 type transport system permease protein
MLQRIGPIFKRDLKGYFSSPAGYVVIVIFLVASALVFFSTFFINKQAEMRRFFELLPLTLGLFIPAIAMGSIAEEKRRGTFETLITMPVRLADVVISKYLTVIVFTLLMILPTVVYGFSISAIGNLDWGAVIGGYIGAVFLIAFYAAIGIFSSSLTENQISALIIAVLISVAFGLLDSFLGLFPSETADTFMFISTGFHFDRFAKGVLDTRSIVYFLSGAVLFLMLAFRVLYKERSAAE